MNKDISNPSPLFEKIAQLIEQARQRVATFTNLTMVHTYFEVGRMIVEEEQEGHEKAVYGKQTLKNISEQLVEKFGAGFSEQNLRNMRQFYLKYSDRSSLPIRQTASSELPAFTLNWSHYLAS